MSKMNNNQSGLSKWYIFPTWILAIMAVIGFIFSVRSSLEFATKLNELTKTLVNLEKQVELSFTPLLKLVDYRWIIKDKTKDISCQNAPIAIDIAYKNVSRVPLRMIDNEIDFYLGELKLSITIRNESKESILSPGEMWHNTFSGIKNFTSKPKKLNERPLIRIKSLIKYSNIEGNVFYIYEATHIIPFSCLEPPTKETNFFEQKIRSFRTELETISQLKEMIK